MARQLVYPGYITSKRDGDQHFITFHQLCVLYMLDPAKAIRVDEHSRGYGEQEGDMHYYPRHDGKYPLFEED